MKIIKRNNNNNNSSSLTSSSTSSVTFTTNSTSTSTNSSTFNSKKILILLNSLLFLYLLFYCFVVINKREIKQQVEGVVEKEVEGVKLEQKKNIYEYENNKKELITSIPQIISIPSPIQTIIPNNLNQFIQNNNNNVFSHPLFDFNQNLQLDEVLYKMYQRNECKNLPIFVTMAKIGSPIYAQLVENFHYTMMKYNLFECSLLICLDDPKCLDFCSKFSFPCYNYSDSENKVSTFQQIAKLKLFTIPQAISKGVSLFIIDIDVGFRRDPRELLGNFMSSSIDILVQKDVTFIMNRTLAGWRTWYTRPLPNLGLFLSKGNERVSKMFTRAWARYQLHEKKLDQPGTDQAITQAALGKRSRSYPHLSWDFFPDDQVVLLDKVYKFQSTEFELGGEIAVNFFASNSNSNSNSNENKSKVNHQVVALHATCYELRTKVDALKAVGAFWNPLYYNPQRRTLTTNLIYYDAKQLQNDIRYLVQLAIDSNRALLIPNIPLGAKKYISFLNSTPSGSIMWPGFRVVYKSPTFPIEIVEPGYYYRIEHDYGLSVPPPFILTIYKKSSLSDIQNTLSKYNDQPRIVLNVIHKSFSSSLKLSYEKEISLWAKTSGFHEIDQKMWQNGIFPVDYSIRNDIRLCQKIFLPSRGNRSCFDKCK